MAFAITELDQKIKELTLASLMEESRLTREGEFLGVPDRVINLLKLGNVKVSTLPIFMYKSNLVSTQAMKFETVLNYCGGYEIYIYSYLQSGQIYAYIGDSLWTLF